MTNKPRKVELDCGHIVYWRVVPHMDDLVWCTRCENETGIAPADARMLGARVYDVEGDFYSIRTSPHRFDGGCTYPDCNETVTGLPSYFKVRDTMHRHYMKAHTRFSTLTIVQSVRPNKKAVPDF